jgi:uncharacterized protein (DUF433 family)
VYNGEERKCHLWSLVEVSAVKFRKSKGGRKMKFNRITVNPNQMGGVPCIRGLRIPVATVVGMVAEGMTEKEILSAYPDLESEDLHEALRYAAEAVRERELPLVNA